MFSVFMKPMLATNTHHFVRIYGTPYRLQILTMLSVFKEPLQATDTYFVVCIIEPTQAKNNHYVVCIYGTHTGYKNSPCCLFLWTPIQAANTHHVVCFYGPPYRLQILTMLSVFMEPI
jgi:hypothetical protein